MGRVGYSLVYKHTAQQNFLRGWSFGGTSAAMASSHCKVGKKRRKDRECEELNFDLSLKYVRISGNYHNMERRILSTRIHAT